MNEWMQSKRKEGNSFSCSLEDEEIMDREKNIMEYLCQWVTYHIMLLIPLAGRWFIPISQMRKLEFRERRSLHKTRCYQWVPEPAGSPGLTLADPAYSSMGSRQVAWLPALQWQEQIRIAGCLAIQTQVAPAGAKSTVRAEHLYLHIHPLPRQNHLVLSQGSFSCWINPSILTSLISENKIQFNLGRKKFTKAIALSLSLEMQSG